MKIRLLIFLLLPLISMAQPARPKMLDINLANFTYPFKVNYLKLHIQNQHLQMAYMDIKPDNYNNKNIVLLHGKNFNGAYWEATINEIVKRGYRVIVPDQVRVWKIFQATKFSIQF